MVNYQLLMAVSNLVNYRLLMSVSNLVQGEKKSTTS